MTSTGKILAGGFGLLFGKPAAVAIWAAIHIAIGLGLSFWMMHQMSASRMLAASSGDPQAALANAGGAMGMAMLAGLVSALVLAVLSCAAFRALLRPEPVGVAWLRIGWDELRMFGLFVVMFIALMIAVLILVLLLMLLLTILGFVLSSAPPLHGIVSVLLCVAAVCAVIYVEVRLALMFPLTFVRRRLVIDEAWELSRGRFWTLFPALFVIALITFALGCAASLPFVWPDLSALLSSIGDPEAMKAAQAAQVEHQLNMPFEKRALMTLLSGIAATIGLALNSGALATAAWGFLADSGKLPEPDPVATAGD